MRCEAGPAANDPGLRAVLRRHAPSATRQRTLEANGVDCGAGPVRAWAAAGDGRTFIVDDSIAPVRWTATVDYQIDAGGEVAAERQAVERYARDAEEAGITGAETVIAAT